MKKITIQSSLLSLALLMLSLIPACTAHEDAPTPPSAPMLQNQTKRQSIGAYVDFCTDELFVHADHVLQMQQQLNATPQASGKWLLIDDKNATHAMSVQLYSQSQLNKKDEPWVDNDSCLGAKVILFDHVCGGCDNYFNACNEPPRGSETQIKNCNCDYSPGSFCTLTYKIVGSIMRWNDPCGMFEIPDEIESVYGYSCG
ncbi:MAG: hypothetical protein AAF570_13380 [Bacteroidota bacterium]